MPISAEQQNRLVNYMFTVDVNDEEKCLQRVDGLEATLAAIDYSGSCMEDVIQLPGHYNMSNLTLQFAPFITGQGGLNVPYPNFLFLVDIGNDRIAHCRSITGVSVTNEVIENFESDQIGTAKDIGLRRYGEVTLSQVMPYPEESGFVDFVERLMKVTGPGADFSSVESQTLLESIDDVTISILDRAKNVVAQFKLRLAYPGGVSFGTLESTGSETWLRNMVIRPMGVDITQGQGSGGFAEWVNSAFTLPQKDTLTLRVYNRTGTQELGDPLAKLKIYNAWPAEVNFGDLDASADDIFTQEVVVAGDGLALS